MRGPEALFTQLYGHRPKRMSRTSYAEKELACLGLVDEAAASFTEGRLAEFDARVGDKNCHILSHLLIELTSRADVVSAVRQLAERAGRAGDVLRSWRGQIGHELPELTRDAGRDGALLDLTSDQVLLTNSFLLKKIVRDQNHRYRLRLRRIGGRIAYERARISINQVTDAHIGAIAREARSHWVRCGADGLADDILALSSALEDAWKLDTFLIRVPYASLALLVDRVWQQGIHVAVRSHVLLPDHQHVLTLLYAPRAAGSVGFERLDAARGAGRARSPVLVLLGLTDVTGSFRDIPVDSFYRTRTSVPVRPDTCRCGVSSMAVDRLAAIDLPDLASAGEAVRPESATAVGRLTDDVPPAARARFLTTFARRRELAMTAGMSAGDASCFRLIHVYPDWVRNLSPAGR